MPDVKINKFRSLSGSRITNRQPIAQPIAMQVLAIAQSKVNASIHKFVTCFYGRLPYIYYLYCIFMYNSTIFNNIYIYILNLMWQFEQVSKPIMIYLVWIGYTRHFGVPVTASITSVSTGRCFQG